MGDEAQLHDAAVQVLRERPELVVRLLERAGTPIALPRRAQVSVVGSEVIKSRPDSLRADLVVRVGGRGRGGRPRLAIVVEVQRGKDADKRLKWPAYVAGVRAELGCAVVLVVIAPDRAVARWARSAIEIGHPGFVLRPVVVGPSEIPLVVDAQIARRHVELAVLSAMAHGHGPHAYEVGLAALRATAMLDEARRGDYSIFVLDALDDAVVLRLEAEMEEGKHRELTSLERHFIGKGIAKGIAEGEAKGRAEGEAKGRTEGEAKGRTEALQQSVLRVLSARGLEVPETVRDRVLACADADLLGEMLTRAATVDCADEVVS